MRFKYYTFILLALIFLLTVACQPTTSASGGGQVVDLTGQPIAGAQVSTANSTAVTDQDGRFTIPLAPHGQWLTVDHPDYLSRTRAIAPDTPIQVSLTPDDEHTISLHFGGDVMFGRRFFDPNEDGHTHDGLLPTTGGVDEHLALLSHVQPLLANADLTVVNLETPLIANPYANNVQPRPQHFHQEKEYIFASHPTAASALHQAGVDMVDLGNNHLYDALEDGLAETLTHLTQADFVLGEGAFGAGLNETEAWTPAVTTIKGQSLAFLGCTTIHGQEHTVSYVADDAQNKGGAANCDEDRIRQAVSAAAQVHDTVVMMIHGGYEYGRLPSVNIQRLTAAAREAGATLVINHHPHVTGGFDWDGSSLVAWTLGNLVFDQTVWPTFESYLLAVHLREGKVVRAYAEPLIVENYVPKGLTGELADFVAGRAVDLSSGPFVVDSGAVESDFAGRYNSEATLSAVAGEMNSPVKLAPGQWGVHENGRFRLGRDLLWVGSFEDEDVDADRYEGTLWDLRGDNKMLLREAAYRGEVGLRLQQKSSADQDLVATHIHRILIEPGTNLSVVGNLRATQGAEVVIQLSWYPDTKGQSSQRTMKTLTVTPNEWNDFRLDVTVPREAVAVGFYLRLTPPRFGLEYADFDDLALIAWEAASE